MTVEGGLPTRVDVVVAGSGAAGLTAALAAAAGGASVVLVERASQLGGTTALSGGRVWIPCNHLPEDDGDTPEAARAYLRGLFSDRYPQMTEAFIANGPAMLRFVEEHSAHRFVACPTYPDYHPSLPGARLGGRAMDAALIDLTKLTPLTGAILVPPGYLPLTHAEWERWRYPQRFDWALLQARQREGLRSNGVSLVAGLLDGAVRAGVRVLTGTRLTGVRLGPDGAVQAADLQREREGKGEGGPGHGGSATVAATSVILATGGFDWDEALRAQLPPPLRATGAPPTNTGDGLRIAEAAGAALDNTGEGWWMPMLSIPGETLDHKPFYRSLIRERALPRQIVVNAAGQRFVAEAQPYNDFGKAMNHRDPHGRYPNAIAYMVFDEGFRRRYPLPGLRPDGPGGSGGTVPRPEGVRADPMVAAGPPDGSIPDWMACAGSLAELAGRIGVDAAGLEGTVRRWNQACAAGSDPEFGRGGNAYERYGGDPEVHPNPTLGPIDQPPYYAVQVLSGTIGTKGGPVTDADGVVLTATGERIAGLYAAGNAAAFWTADGYPAPGATLGVAMTMGYLAGRHAAARQP